MAIVIKPITVEVSKPNVFQAIAAKQNDSNSRFLKVTFANEGEKIFVTPSANVTINAERNDGESNSFFGAVNDDGTVTVPIHSWILELPGYVNCDVSIIEEDSKLTCTTFSLLVEEASHGSNDISNDEQGDVLVTLINDVKEMQSGGVFGNAIQNTVTGSIVSLTDISPLEHTLSVKARSDNLIDFLRPATETRLSYCTLNEDGKTITSKFTDDYYSSISLYYLGDFLLKNKGKTITFSVKESYGDVSLAIVIHGDMTTGKTYQSDSSPLGATSLSLKISEDFTKISRIELRFNRAGVPFTTDREFTEFKLAFDTKATPYTHFVPIGSISKSYTIEENAKAYISITDIDKCIAKSKAEGRTYANGIESFEIRFSSEGDGFYFIDGWSGSEAELLDQWGIKMLKAPEYDGDSYVFNLFYKDGTNLNAVVMGKNQLPFPYYYNTNRTISGVDFVINEDRSITIKGTATANTYFYLVIGKNFGVSNMNASTNASATNGEYALSKWLMYYAKDKETYIYIPNGTTVDETIYPQVQIGNVLTEYEPYTKVTHSINADGTVEGVTSIYPVTTITSDTEGVVFDIGYNADTKKYINNKFAELAALIVNS